MTKIPKKKRKKLIRNKIDHKKAMFKTKYCFYTRKCKYKLKCTYKHDYGDT